MRKINFMTLLVALIGLFTVNASAYTLKVEVDNASNITMAPDYGNGTPYELQSGAVTTLDIDKIMDCPIVVKANPGAQITSITIDGVKKDPTANGTYSFNMYAFSGDSAEMKIETSGQGTAPKETVNVTIGAVGDGITVTGVPYTVQYQDGDNWVDPDHNGMRYDLPVGALIKITPEPTFAVDKILPYGSDVPLEITTLEDGSVTFTNNLENYSRINITLKLAPGVISFKLSVDYPGNVEAYLEYQRDGSNWETLELNEGENTFFIKSQANPLEIKEVTGGKILQVLRNGEVALATGWGGVNGYVFEVEDGDVFSVSTEGPEIEVTIKANSDTDASLDAYYFRLADGTDIKLSGREANLKAHQGEYVYVSGRPGTEYTMLMGSNGAVTASDWMSWFRVTPGLQNKPAVISLIGTRNINGVAIDVDNSARVKVTQEGGRGETLTLTDGVNNFALADLKNALAVTSTEGNQITSVTLNGDAIAANASGSYLANVEEGAYLQVKSRKNPVDTKINLSMLNENTELKWINVKVNGYEIETAATFNVKTYDVISFTAAPGYILQHVECNEPTAAPTYISDPVEYRYYLSSADVSEINFGIVAKEMTPEDGYAIVVPEGNELLIRYWDVELVEEDGEQRYAKVQTLANNTVNQVKIGDYVQVYMKDGLTKYRSIKVNGEELSADQLKNRAVYIEVTGRTEIKAECYAPTYVYSTNSIDDNRHVTSGIIRFEVNGEKVNDFYAEPGMTCKFIPEPADGYMFDHIEFFYPLTIDSEGIKIEGDTYTFTAEDCAYEFLLFKGVFKADDNNPVYKVCGSSAWILNDKGEFDEKTSQSIGSVYIRDVDGSSKREYVGFAGDEVTLEIHVLDETYLDEYEVAGFALMSGFPNNVRPTKYVLSADDANTAGEIWICGMIRKKGAGVDGIASEGFRYDHASGIIYAQEAVKVFDINGNLLIDEAAGEVSTATLGEGIYIAVSGGKTVKFVK